MLSASGRSIDQWLIIGGRRWARTIANELCAILPPNRKVVLLSDPTDLGLIEWRSNNRNKDRLQIIDQIELCPSPKIGIAIVANSAYLHRSSTESALDAGYHVISEKPLTLSKQESMNLLEKAKNLNLKLFSTNTYLFADYLREFRQNYLFGRKISQLDIQWADPIEESRYGERKKYDSSTPIIYDILPHAACIVLATYGEVNVLKSDIHVSKGGSEVALRVECKDLIITMSLARNSRTRKRLIRFSGMDLDVELDFTEEPGFASKRRPIEQMLHSAIHLFEKGEEDDRLSSNAALLGNELIDSVVKDYADQQMAYLNLMIHRKCGDDAYFAYALREAASLKTRAMAYLSNESPLLMEYR
jgi:hypothetical protein